MGWFWLGNWVVREEKVKTAMKDVATCFEKETRRPLIISYGRIDGRLSSSAMHTYNLNQRMAAWCMSYCYPATLLERNTHCK
jgi:hypothetical protein